VKNFKSILFLIFILLLSSCSKDNFLFSLLNKNKKESIKDLKEHKNLSWKDLDLHLDTVFTGDIIIEEISDPIIVKSSPRIQIEEKVIIIKEDPKQVIIEKSVLERKNWTEGRTVYQIPSNMKVGNQYTVFLRISRNSKKVEIYNGVSGEVITSIIPTSNSMSVELIDPSNSERKMFHITSVNSNIQTVLDGIAFTEWVWSVTPIRSGKSNLKIIIKIVQDNTPIEKVYSQEVKVKVNPTLQVWMFIEKWWMWIITTILIPVVSWWFKNKYKK
jgi:hypothetical protein